MRIGIPLCLNGFRGTFEDTGIIGGIHTYVPTRFLFYFFFLILRFWSFKAV